MTIVVIAKVAAVLQGWERSHEVRSFHVDRSIGHSMDAGGIVAMGINGITGSVHNRGD